MRASGDEAMAESSANTINIEGSPARLLLLTGLGVIMTALSAVIGLDLVPDMGADAVTWAISVFGAFFFGFCTLIALWRLLFVRGPVITISPEGIRDRRVAADVIPWSAIRRISTWEHSGQRVLVLNVDPAVERTLRLSMIAKYTRGANRALGADGLAVTAQGLKISYDELWKLVEARVPAAARG
jgi:hypothetical protein